MTYSPFAYLRRCAKAQRSLIHHIKVMLQSRRDKLNEERASLARGEKIKPPSDLIGALVASQMEAEAEALLGTSEAKIVGLTNKEIIGNACQPRHLYAWLQLTFSHLHRVGLTLIALP
jgi:hypothetical protein